MCCTYCKKSGHTKDKCWKLHGKPPNKEKGKHEGQQHENQISPWIQTSSDNQAQQIAALDDKNTATSIEGFNKEEIQKLKKLLGSFEQTTKTCSLAVSGSELKEDLEEEYW